MTSEKVILDLASIAFKEVVGHLIKSSYDKSKKLIGKVDIKSKADQFIDSGVQPYLSRQLEKFYTIKTILTGNEPLYFYKVYYPLDIVIEHRDTQILKKVESSDDCFSVSKCVALSGEAGSGKTTLLKHIFIRTVNEKKSIPVFIELRNVEPNKNAIKQHIIENTLRGEFSEQIDKDIFEIVLESGGFTFFFDGYDEIAGDNYHQMTKDLDNFIFRYKKNRYLLTSRPYSGMEALSGFTSLRVAKLNYKRGDVLGFIDLQLNEQPELRDLIKASVINDDTEYVDSFLENPLLLSLYILTFNKSSKIPRKKFRFYRRVIDVLMSEHDSKTKFGYERPWSSKLIQEEVEEILKIFCFISYFEGMFSFEIDDLIRRLAQIKEHKANLVFSERAFINDMKVCVSLWLEDGQVITFVHRSLQEYFAALFLNESSIENKQYIYKKLRSDDVSTIKLSETENFLSLCEEMDEESFLKLYSIPLLEELVDALNGEDSLSQYFDFFFDGIYADSERNTSGFTDIFLIEKPNVRRYLHYMNHFFLVLRSMLSSLDIGSIFKRAHMEREYYIGGSAQYLFSEHMRLKNSLLTELRNKGADDKINNLSAKIKMALSTKREVVNQSVQENMDIVGLIFK